MTTRLASPAAISTTDMTRTATAAAKWAGNKRQQGLYLTKRDAGPVFPNSLIFHLLPFATFRQLFICLLLKQEEILKFQPLFRLLHSHLFYITSVSFVLLQEAYCT
jgi:ABC-type sugar transport system permease subunit